MAESKDAASKTECRVELTEPYAAGNDRMKNDVLKFRVDLQKQKQKTTI
jgi:hypothetical protein